MSNTDDEQSVTTKKRTFNKKKWREEKYSVKAKVKRWDDNRKKNMIRKYRRELKKECGADGDGKVKGDPRVNNKVTALKKAQLELERIEKEKSKKREEVEKANSERKEALKAYREKKAARYKKLSQRNSKGQPIMKGRIELLLEKIQKNYASDNS